MTELQWLHAALLTAAVVFGLFTAGALFIALRGELRARKRPDPYQDYFDSLGAPDKRGEWF